MTTNARGEKWSEWQIHDGKSVPLDDGKEFQYRLDDGEELFASGPASEYRSHFLHLDGRDHIIAYRYKIKEPESDMHPDLEWLARNVSEWKQGPGLRLNHEEATHIRRHLDEHCLGYGSTNDEWFTRAQWQAARQQLGLDQPEVTPEEDEAWEDKEREQSKSDGSKYDSDKPMMDLIPPHMEEEVAMVLTFGAKKYAPDNWRKVSPLRSRYLAAAQRHINALKKGEQMDPESGLHHAAHAVCCLMFLGEVELEPRND